MRELYVLECTTPFHEGETREIEAYIDPDDIERWKAGEFIQNAMPYLGPDLRELLISGTCGDCFDKIFPPEDD